MVVMKRWWGWLEVNSEREDAVWYFYVCKAVNCSFLGIFAGGGMRAPGDSKGKGPDE